MTETGQLTCCQSMSWVSSQGFLNWLLCFRWASTLALQVILLFSHCVLLCVPRVLSLVVPFVSARCCMRFLVLLVLPCAGVGFALCPPKQCLMPRPLEMMAADFRLAKLPNHALTIFYVCSCCYRCQCVCIVTHLGEASCLSVLFEFARPPPLWMVVMLKNGSGCWL